MKIKSQITSPGFMVWALEFFIGIVGLLSLLTLLSLLYVAG